MSEFKFARYKNGIGAFAAISVELIAGAEGSVVWDEAVAGFERFHGEAVQLGIRDALQWHVEAGGAPAAFVVLDFTELIVDTRPDAVRCAATGAAWEALGHRGEDLVFALEGEWFVRRR